MLDNHLDVLELRVACQTVFVGKHFAKSWRLISIFLMFCKSTNFCINVVLGCDEYKWQNTKNQYENCVQSTQTKIAQYKMFEPKICG